MSAYNNQNRKRFTHYYYLKQGRVLTSGTYEEIALHVDMGQLLSKEPGPTYPNTVPESTTSTDDSMAGPFPLGYEVIDVEEFKGVCSII